MNFEFNKKNTANLKNLPTVKILINIWVKGENIISASSSNKNNSHQKTIIEKYYDNNNRVRGKDNYISVTILCINRNTNNANNPNYSISSL